MEWFRGFASLPDHLKTQNHQRKDHGQVWHSTIEEERKCFFFPNCIPLFRECNLLLSEWYSQIDLSLSWFSTDFQSLDFFGRPLEIRNLSPRSTNELKEWDLKKCADAEWKLWFSEGAGVFEGLWQATLYPTMFADELPDIVRQQLPACARVIFPQNSAVSAVCFVSLYAFYGVLFAFF